MPSAKQIKARKAFVKKFAKKGKRGKKGSKSGIGLTARERRKLQTKIVAESRAKSKKPKSTVEYDESGKMVSFGDPHKKNFSSDWDKKMQEFLNRTNNES